MLCWNWKTALRLAQGENNEEKRKKKKKSKQATSTTRPINHLFIVKTIESIGDFLI